MRALRACCRLTVLAFLLWAAASRAQEVGQINELESQADIGQGTAEWSPAARGTAVSVGTELRTYTPGRLRLYFHDERVPTAGRAEILGPDTRLRISAVDGRSVDLILKRGWLNALGPCRTRSGRCESNATGTEYIVHYDDEADVSEIVGVSGEVVVRNVTGGPSVTVGPREYTRVVGGSPPTMPRFLDDVAFQTFLAVFEFVGDGEAESQTIGHPLLTGEAVPDPDRAPVPEPPDLPGDNWGPIEEPIDQPWPVIESTGLGIDF